MRLTTLSSPPQLAPLALLAALCLLASACGHRKPHVSVPPPPEPPEQNAPAGSGKPANKPANNATNATKKSTHSGGGDAAQQVVIPPPASDVLFSETGLASWYGAAYHRQKASNGEIFDMNGLTAAHRTLPLNSVARVTNLKTGASATVRITDRGPFVTGRVLDLSQGAAKAVGVYLPGVAQVRVDVLSSPAPLGSGGRWCVQIGGFTEESNAASLKDELSAHYPQATVQQFRSVVGSWWLRIRLPKDDKALSERIVRDTTPSQGAVFLVRLD